MLTDILHKAMSTIVHEWDNESLGENVRVKIKNDKDKKKFFATLDLNTYTQEELDSGSTLCAAIYNSNNRKLHIGNIGDSRFVFKSNTQLFTTIDHDVSKKIEKKIGFKHKIIDRRLAGDLAMCRAIGDNCHDLLGVVGSEIDMYTEQLGDENVTCILGSDGLYDEYTNQKLFIDKFTNAKQFIVEKGGADKFADNTSIIMMHIPAAVNSDR